jgi:hypothetical protein
LRGGDGHDARRRRGDEDRLGAHHLARVSKHQKWGSSRITRLACSRRVASREVPGCLRRGRASTRRATLPSSCSSAPSRATSSREHTSTGGHGTSGVGGRWRCRAGKMS